MSGIGTGLAIAGGIGATAGIGAAAIQSNAVGKAASTQANAATQAAQMQAQLGQESLQNENYQYQQGRANEMPWLQGGANSLSSLEYLMGLDNSATGQGTQAGGQTLSIPGVQGGVTLPGVQGISASPNTNLGAFGSLMKGYGGGQFQAPTAEQARLTPGYQFGLQQGEGALQAGAAANGNLLTGGTQTALNQYGQNYADTNYNNVYNQALQTYNTNYNVWANDQANQFNRLSSLAGGGQTAAQNLSSAGQNEAGQVANTLSNTGQQVGQNMNNAAAATASGYIGSANAWGGALNNSGNSLMQMMMLNQMFGNQGSSSSVTNDVNDMFNGTGAYG